MNALVLPSVITTLVPHQKAHILYRYCYRGILTVLANPGSAFVREFWTG
jgi:hypothetical protein